MPEHRDDRPSDAGESPSGPPSTEQPTVEQPRPAQPTAEQPHPEQPAAAQSPPPPPPPPGYPVAGPAPAQPAGNRFGRFVRHRATQIVAAAVVGALVGGGTVALVDDHGSNRPHGRSQLRNGPNRDGGPGPWRGHRGGGNNFGGGQGGGQGGGRQGA